MVIERLRQLPYALQIIVVDDCSQDGTAAIVEGLDDVELRAPRAQPGQGRRAALGVRARPRPHRRDPGRRPRVRPGRHPRARRADPLGRRRRRLRVAPDRRPPAARAPVLAQGRQQGALAAHERPLQHHAVRHGDRLQGLHDRGAALDRAALRVGLPDRARAHGEDLPRRLPHLRGADRVLRPLATTRARRSPGATGSRRCSRSSSTASGTGSACGARFAAVAGIVVSVVFGWLAIRGLDFHEVRRRSGRADLAWILAAVVVSVLGVAMRSERWRALFPRESRPGHVPTFWASQIGLLANNVLPTAGGRARAHARAQPRVGPAAHGGAGDGRRRARLRPRRDRRPAARDRLAAAGCVRRAALHVARARDPRGRRRRRGGARHRARTPARGRSAPPPAVPAHARRRA